MFVLSNGVYFLTHFSIINLRFNLSVFYWNDSFILSTKRQKQHFTFESLWLCNGKICKNSVNDFKRHRNIYLFIDFADQLHQVLCHQVIIVWIFSTLNVFSPSVFIVCSWVKPKYSRMLVEKIEKSVGISFSVLSSSFTLYSYWKKKTFLVLVVQFYPFKSVNM